jgi:hypothetical protein
MEEVDLWRRLGFNYEAPVTNILTWMLVGFNESQVTPG